MPSEPLLPGAVHVWRARLDVSAALRDRLAATLTPEERERAARFRTPQLASRFLAGRGIVRDVLARYLRGDPAALRFTTGERGKPALADEPSLRFNASNSGGVTLVAVTRGREVGVDVEELRPVPEALAIAQRMLGPGERAALQALPADQLEEAFLTCWTRKEAFIKGIGAGLWTGLDAFEVEVGPGEPCLRSVGGSAREAARWTLLPLHPGPGLVGAVVAEGPIDPLRSFDWVG